MNGRVAVAGDSEQSGKFRTAAVICMILLALIGVALATAQSSIAFRYWVLLVPIYGLISVGSAWYQEHEGSRWGMVTRQALHWGAVMGVVGIDFYVRQGGAETTSAAGLSSLLLLALGSFLAGVHFDRQFMALGVLLGLAVVIMSKINQYNWLIFAAGALLMLALAGYHFYRHRRRKASYDPPDLLSII